MDAEKVGSVETVSETFAAFVTTSSWSDIAPRLRHEAKRSLLNFFGCVLGAAKSDPIVTAVEIMRRFSGEPQASLIGRPERLDILGASFINAAAANLFDYDDTHLRTVIHPTAPVAAAVLALAEAGGCSALPPCIRLFWGSSRVPARERRIARSLRARLAHYGDMWRVRSRSREREAARLVGIQAANALGIAASLSAGLVENLPSAAKNVGVGNAARNGLFAALMAQTGYEAAPTSIEGPLGWARASGDAPDVSAMRDGLGNDWSY